MADQLELAQSIAELLGNGWTAKINDYGNYARLSHRDVESIYLRGNGWNWEESKRLEISGIYPRWHNQGVLYSNLPKITCAISRGGAAIAGDIERKFLPRYWPLVEEAKQQIEQYEEAQATVTANVELLAQTVQPVARMEGLWEFAGWTHRTPEQVRVSLVIFPTGWGAQHIDPAKSQRTRTDSIRDMYGKATVGTDTVSIELCQVPLALALQIGRVIGEYKQDDDTAAN